MHEGFEREVYKFLFKSLLYIASHVRFVARMDRGTLQYCSKSVVLCYFCCWCYYYCCKVMKIQTFKR